MISFGNLWLTLAKKKMKKTDLVPTISPTTLAKLGKNASVTTDTIDKLCEFLDCQPSDIMEYISEQERKDLLQKLDEAQRKAKEMSEMLLSIAEARGADTPEEQEKLEKFLKMAREMNQSIYE